jgi:hypothetical protein
MNGVAAELLDHADAGQAVEQSARARRQPEPGADRGQPLMHQQDRRTGLRFQRGGRSEVQDHGPDRGA